MNFLGVEAKIAQDRARHGAAREGETTRQRRVVMLVSNPCVNDSRVIRAAESIAAEGHEVFVLATTAKGVPATEVRNGVTYRRFGIGNSKGGLRLPRFVTRQKSRLVLRKQPKAVHVAPATPRQRSFAARAAKAVVLVLKRAYALLQRHGNSMIAISCATAASLLVFVALRTADLFEVSSLFSVLMFGLAYGCGLVVGFACIVMIGSKRSFPKRLRSVLASDQWVKNNLRVAYTSLRSEVLFKEPMRDLKPDVIHAHDFATLPVAAKVARETGAVCVYDSHELEMHRNIKRSKLDSMLCGRLERRYIRAVDGVITVCDSIADHLADHYGIARPTVVMNAPSYAEIDGSERDVRSDLGLAVDTPLAIYVGSITIGRGIETIVRSLRDLPKFHLVLLGPANKTTLEAALAIAQRDGTADRLHVLPPVAPNAVVSYIRSADVSLVLIQNVCLSYYFCLPNKLVESTIAGLPVVASDFPEMKRFVEMTRTGVVTNERDATAIARSIQEAYDRRHELRPDEERKIIIEKFYGWETQRRRMVEVYETLLDARESRAPAP